ncbi:MAG TPA: alpha/beta hydrolase [Burkholderiales bacterium]|jgi:3-oxoadipate enol-lactonase|nr:alpha/beta hydrolase [Burkholderiales bacterium]
MKLQRGGAQIHYEVFGKGPAIVFAHGLGGNHLSWWQQVAHFSPTHTCVVFAHRGFPPSSPVSGKSAPDSYGDDLAALLDELKLDQVSLVAQSMGGWTCLDYALREPKRVRALVMASTSGAVDFRPLGNAEVDEWTRLSPTKLANLQSRGIHAAGGERMAREQPALAQLYGQISSLAPLEFRDEVRNRIREMRTRAPGLLAELPMPVLFVTGDEDWVFPPAAGPALARLAPKGSAVRVPAAGHSVYFERAAQFNDIIGRIL